MQEGWEEKRERKEEKKEVGANGSPRNICDRSYHVPPTHVFLEGRGIQLLLFLLGQLKKLGKRDNGLGVGPSSHTAGAGAVKGLHFLQNILRLGVVKGDQGQELSLVVVVHVKLVLGGDGVVNLLLLVGEHGGVDALLQDRALEKHTVLWVLISWIRFFPSHEGPRVRKRGNLTDQKII